MLHINDLSISVRGKPIISHLSLSIPAGQVHLLQGPNGAGKSSLLYAIMGHPLYQQTGGEIVVQGTVVNDLPVHDRARLGIFLAFQQPPALPGVSVSDFLYQTYCAYTQTVVQQAAFMVHVVKACDELTLDHAFLTRSFNEGFSGGERKRMELLQLLLLQPKLLLLDEIDTGLDADGLQQITKVIQRLRERAVHTTVLFVSHQPKSLRFDFDQVHTMQAGKIIKKESDASAL